MIQGLSHMTFIVHDLDNHMFELHTGTLDERLARDARGAK